MEGEMLRAYANSDPIAGSAYIGHAEAMPCRSFNVGDAIVD